MTKIKLGKRELRIKFGYEATAASGIIKSLAVYSRKTDTEEEHLNRMNEIINILADTLLVGLQKFHGDEFGYDYETGAGKRESRSKVCAILDDYFDEEDSDFEKLMEVLQEEMLKNGFLAKMFKKEMEEAEEKDTKAEKEGKTKNPAV